MAKNKKEDKKLTEEQADKKIQSLKNLLMMTVKKFQQCMN